MVPLYHSLWIHLTGGHLGRFQFGAIMNRAAITIHVGLLVWT